MDVMDQVVLLFVSLVANLFSAFSGGGAGLIQLPVLIFMGLPFAIALATHKVASVALGIGATVRHLRERPLEWQLTLYILALVCLESLPVPISFWMSRSNLPGWRLEY